MAKINISISVSTDEYGSRTCAQCTLNVPVVGVNVNPTAADIDAIEEQLGTRIAQVRRELSTQIATAREQAEKDAAA